MQTLDGVRGIAALVVLVHHVLLLSRVVAEAHAGEPIDGWAWFLLNTPLHIAFAGEEAVLVFFVLSGLVLARPYLDGRPLPTAYYPRRLARLYLPVLAAGVLVVAIRALDHAAPEHATWWLALHAQAPDRAGVFTALTLFGDETHLNGVLWSLKYEVVFSMALGGYLFLARLAPARPLRLVVGLAVLSGLPLALGLTGPVAAYWSFMPIFGVGVVLARHERAVRRWDDRLHGSAPMVVTGAAVVLLTARWWLAPLHQDSPSPLLFGIGRTLTVLGAALVVALALGGRRAGWLEHPGIQWAGSRSFSLYLVHVPVIVTLALVFDLDPPSSVWRAVLVVASLLAAEGFFRLVERPATRFSRQLLSD